MPSKHSTASVIGIMRARLLTLLIAVAPLAGCAAQYGYRVSGDKVTWLQPVNCGANFVYVPYSAQSCKEIPIKVPADGKTLRTIVDPNIRKRLYYYAVDEANVFYKGELVPDADPETFQYELGRPFPFDKNAIYRGTTRIETETPRRQRYIDKPGGGLQPAYLIFDHVYISGVDPVLEGVDFETIERIGRLYLKDKNHVYYQGNGGNNLEVCDYSTFDTVRIWIPVESPTRDGYWSESDWAIDQSCVYHHDIIIKDVDVSSFEVTGWRTAGDKERMYTVSYDKGIDDLRLSITDKAPS